MCLAWLLLIRLHVICRKLWHGPTRYSQMKITAALGECWAFECWLFGCLWQQDGRFSLKGRLKARLSDRWTSLWGDGWFDQLHEAQTQQPVLHGMWPNDCGQNWSTWGFWEQILMFIWVLWPSLYHSGQVKPLPIKNKHIYLIWISH